jgi:hypothetical protein
MLLCLRYRCDNETLCYFTLACRAISIQLQALKIAGKGSQNTTEIHNTLKTVTTENMLLKRAASLQHNKLTGFAGLKVL